MSSINTISKQKSFNLKPSLTDPRVCVHCCFTAYDHRSWAYEAILGVLGDIMPRSHILHAFSSCQIYRMRWAEREAEKKKSSNAGENLTLLSVDFVSVNPSQLFHLEFHQRSCDLY
ncbi:unnamed protein product [Rangifer tarandus platyrhynchus]|uniref:Uncharacterized protein n=2 Tax=Rangifer tarandus platyrhynchus TaxID=3082113 RepID=A0ABN8Y361_RANTA|nr:unnamed protein product [Rangifer tarandus platyrhynchus]CAI9712668.1 unnamed protein product [Rangifer tarandus platyrhynchus]